MNGVRVCEDVPDALGVPELDAVHVPVIVGVLLAELDGLGVTVPLLLGVVDTLDVKACVALCESVRVSVGERVNDAVCVGLRVGEGVDDADRLWIVPDCVCEGELADEAL